MIEVRHENFQPGGQSSGRPPKRWMCRCGTVSPPSRPLLMTRRKKGEAVVVLMDDIGGDFAIADFFEECFFQHVQVFGCMNS